MHNIKDLRTNLDNFKKSISGRNSEIDFEKIINLDKENRSLIQEKEKFEMEKKIFQNQKTNLYLKNQKKFL